MDGLTESNANGDLPLTDLDLRNPNEKYFAPMGRQFRWVNTITKAASERSKLPWHQGAGPDWVLVIDAAAEGCSPLDTSQ